MASYDFGRINPDSTDIRDELIKLKRTLEYFGQNLNHRNVKTLFTEYCQIQSEDGETVIDGPLILMYSATDSTTLRLEMGYDSSEFVFNLYNLAGVQTVHMDSSGNAAFTGTITASQITGSTITGGNIAGSTISGAQITASTLTASQITASTISAAQITGSTITASQITASTITASQITASSIIGGYIYGSTIVGGQITGSCIATSENLFVGEQIMVGSSSIDPPLTQQRGIYFGTTDNGLQESTGQFMTLKALGGMQIISDGSLAILQDNSTDDFSVIQTNASGETCFPIICVSSGQRPSFGLVISDHHAYYGSAQSTDCLGKRKWWKNFTPNVTYAGGPPSSFSTKICRYAVTDYDGWVTLDIESTDGNNAVITAIGDPTSYDVASYGDPWGCWVGIFNVNSTISFCRVYKFDTTNFVITGAPTLTDNKAWSFMMQGFFGA